ncbi:MAG TPA: threonine synthase [Euryarchaeota archaeon]|nr:threonine synthase [archaeon BMS3Bbin15]HDL15388.1 threonine synthase [Euryarchaeota archaeon]
MFELRCIKCDAKYSSSEIIYRCHCGGLLEVNLDLNLIEVTREKLRRRRFNLWRYREFMPVSKNAKIISLEEGGTPLYKADRISKSIGIKKLYVKNEGANPTGSFKDRGMTMGVTKAIELGVNAVGCASTGNTSASLAAYSAKAGIKCYVLLPSGKIAMGKLAQAILHGAMVIGIHGNFDVAFKLIQQASKAFNIYLLNSINPWRLEGQKSEAYEIIDQLDFEPPDRVILPVGNCGNISAIWKGFKEFYGTGLINEMPEMTGIQAEGASPVVTAVKSGKDKVEPLENPETIATAIRIGAPVNASKALKAIKESSGTAEAVSDEEIIDAQKLLARTIGVGVEPASASSIAGLKKLVESGEIDKSERVVCITTGNALKDPEVILSHYKKPVEIEPSLKELERIIRR